ncbi:hypothetical protein D3C85_1640450 [compost metagenome]
MISNNLIVCILSNVDPLGFQLLIASFNKLTLLFDTRIEILCTENIGGKRLPKMTDFIQTRTV